jgi:hypothetical protein
MLMPNGYSKILPSPMLCCACPSFTVSAIASVSSLAFFALPSTAASAKRCVIAPIFVMHLSFRLIILHTFLQYRILWTGSLKMHTLHVIDACRACWHAATRLPPNPAGVLYVTRLIQRIFVIFCKGTTLQTKAIRIRASSTKSLPAFSESRPTFMEPSHPTLPSSTLPAFAKWPTTSTQSRGRKCAIHSLLALNLCATHTANLFRCTEAGITSTPLLSFIDQELLYESARAVF